jgi:G3E family GTPase
MMGADASDRDGFAAGNAAFKAGAFDEAVAHFSRAISVQPDDERVWSNRCAAHLRRGDLDAAEADAARCAELAPRWHKAHYRVGKVQHERGELVAAWQSYYTAHVLEPALPLYAHMMAAVDERLAAPDAADAARAELRALKLRILKVDPMAALTPSDPSRCVPVTVLSGFLGAGKTSLLRHVLSARHGLRLAVIVNDMAELNVDAALVRAAGVQGVAVVRADDRLIELSNGCICCTLREDLLAEVAALCLAEPRYDGIVIESSGISEPTPVAQTFLYEDLLGRSLAHLARLDTMVTVVDAQRFALDLESGDALAARGLGARDGDARGIGELLVSQAECADVFLLNKADLVSADHLAQLGASLRALNPGAEQLVCSHGVVAVARVLHTGLFDWAKAMRSPGWLRELSAAAHAPESEAYGVRSFVYRRARPFHAARLAALLRARREEPSHCMHARKLLRSKGFWWLDDAPALRLEWATAAADFNVRARTAVRPARCLPRRAHANRALTTPPTARRAAAPPPPPRRRPSTQPRSRKCSAAG